MQTIYIDVLLSVNLVINYLLLSAVSFYTHTRVTVKRLLFGAAVGALCSLTILLPVVPFLLNMIIKALVGGLTIISAFGIKRLRDFLKLYAVFLTATFFFCGIVIALWLMFTPKNLLIKNSVIYLHISPVMLILSSAVCYCLFRLFHSIAGRHEFSNTFCSLTIKHKNNALCVNAKIDTGNTLKEPFSQNPVIVIGRRTAECITPVEALEYEKVTSLKYRSCINNIRFVPFTSVNGEGILPCFKAEEVYINDIKCDKAIYIALCNDEYIKDDFQAIVPYEIF